MDDYIGERLRSMAEKLGASLEQIQACTSLVGSCGFFPVQMNAAKAECLDMILDIGVVLCLDDKDTDPGEKWFYFFLIHARHQKIRVHEAEIENGNRIWVRMYEADIDPVTHLQGILFQKSERPHMSVSLGGAKTDDGISLLSVGLDDYIPMEKAN